MFNSDNVTIKNSNKNWPYTVLLAGPSVSGKTNTLFNLIQQGNNIIDKFYLYAKILEEPKYQLLIRKREQAGIKNINGPNAVIKYWNSMDDIYDNINDYNPKRTIKVLIVFDDMIAHIMTNKKFQAIIKELFIRSRKLNISICFTTQSYYATPKDVRLNSTHYLILEVNNRRELQNIAINDSAKIDYKDF